MNIAFDIGGIPAFRGGGIEMALRNEFAQLIRLYPEHQFFPFDLFGEPVVYTEFVGQNVHPQYYFVGKNALLRQYRGDFTDLLGALIKSFIKKYHIEVFFITAPFLSTNDIGYNAIYQREWFTGVAVVTALYDIIPYIYKKDYLPDKKSYSWYMSCVEMLRWVDGIVAISKSAKEDLIEQFDFSEERVVVAYLGASDQFQRLEIASDHKKNLLTKFGITQPFILCSNSADWRKNSQNALLGYAGLPEEIRSLYQFVVVGRTSEDQLSQYHHIISQNHLDGHVIFTGYVTDQELVELYNLTELLVFPSLYEGFGLPLIEAWKCGTAVISSNNSSLGELNFIKELTFDPKSTQSITQCMRYALSGAQLGDIARSCYERSKSFTWENTAQELMKAFEKFKKEKKGQSIQVKALLVFFGNIAPSQSWNNLVVALSRRIPVVVASEFEQEAWSNYDIPVIRLSQIRQEMTPETSVIYCCPDRVEEKYISILKQNPGHWLLLDENMDRLVSCFDDEKSQNKDHSFGIATKVSTYFSNSPREIAEAKQIQEFASAIILAGRDTKKKQANTLLTLPVYDIDPAGNAVSSKDEVKESILQNLVSTFTDTQIIQNRSKSFKRLMQEIQRNRYTRQELRAFSKTLGMAFSQDYQMKHVEKDKGDSELENEKLHIAMVTSWNTKCGIAEYTKYFCDALGDQACYRVFPNRTDMLLGPEDAHTAPRVWDYHGDVDRLGQALLADKSEIVHIQYTEGFFTSESLCKLVEILYPAKKVFITCHNTKYLKVSSKKHRIVLNKANYIVHQKSDRAILEKLGIKSDRINEIPLGQMQIQDRSAEAVQKALGISSTPIIGSYGFLLPHKGVLRVIQAVAMLKEKYPKILYIACCSLFNGDASIGYYQECMRMISQLGLEQNVKMISDFLKPEESTYILQSCDALVMAYDDSGESASGAVRFCIATKRPLITTHYDIFKEFEDCTLQIPDNEPETIAHEIDYLLSDTAKMQEYIQKMEKKIQ